MTIPTEVLQSFNAVSPDYFAQSRNEVLPYIPVTVKKLLDLGCNRGAFGFLIKLLFGAEVWGVDYDAEFAEIAKKQLDNVIIGDINVVMTDLPDHYFDCISCNDVLEHLVDPYSVLTLLKAKLAPGGVIVCSIPNVRYWDNFKNFLLRKQWRYTDHGILDRTHLRFFTELSIRDMFDSLGFDILRLEGITPSGSRNLKLFNFLTGGALRDVKYLQFACVIQPRTSA
jgi:2-polyprenyl-3-methyl-5-hydroxy-6-metoxy-1,4-benzoquinol methylase